MSMCIWVKLSQHKIGLFFLFVAVPLFGYRVAVLGRADLECIQASLQLGQGGIGFDAEASLELQLRSVAL
jgi:hypothetical protein